MTPPMLRYGFSQGRIGADPEGLAHELMAERAAALGRAGQAVEIALARLKDADDPDPASRARLLKAAAEAVWAFFVQREVCGFRDQRGVIAEYQIPKAVLMRLGAR
jgi:hypothetical protein